MEKKYRASALAVANRFSVAADGWVQLSPVGEFPHGSGVVQVGTDLHEFIITVRELKSGLYFYDSFKKKAEPAAKAGTASKTLGGPTAVTDSNEEGKL